MSNARTLVVALAVLLAVAPVARTSNSTVESLIEEGRHRSQAKTILEELCGKIGGRTTGTPQLRKAEEWAAAKFKEFGVPVVRLEKWGETPITFERGPRQIARMVKPFRRDFVFSTNNFTAGTKGMTRGRAMVLPENMDAFNANKAKYAGAWILMPAKANMGGIRLANPTELDKALDAAGIAGRVYSTGDARVWTSGRWNDYTDETRPKTPLVFVRGSDYEAVTMALAGTSNVELEFDIENRFISEPMPLHNVVAEIPGSEKPDEVVILCAHLDSWNGPGSKGAQDNGTGVSVVLEAARLLVKSGAKPKRTIRFILWTGEEQGLLGSQAYCEQHKDELSKISAVLNEDSGGNYHSVMNGTADMVEMLRAAVEPMGSAFPGMGVTVNQIERFSAGGGSDHASFVQRGVPGFTFRKAGGIDYGHSWHTQNDTPDLVPAVNLAQMSTNMAVIGFNLANADALLPRIRRD